MILKYEKFMFFKTVANKNHEYKKNKYTHIKKLYKSRKKIFKKPGNKNPVFIYFYISFLIKLLKADNTINLAYKIKTAMV